MLHVNLAGNENSSPRERKSALSIRVCNPGTRAEFEFSASGNISSWETTALFYCWGLNVTIGAGRQFAVVSLEISAKSDSHGI
jgi:hypothetical protein